MTTLQALLLTDVVDSTRLTEQLGDAAIAVLWAAHDRAARDLLPTWRGREIDKTDGMLLLFAQVADAVGYALAYHRALAALGLPFKARAGIHVGPVTLRPNPADDVARGAKPVEVDGLALPIAARVMSLALGGQTLLSADARLALGVVPQRVQSHGHWRMHGVAEPVELFEIGEAGHDGAAPFTAPPDSAKVYRVVRQNDLWLPVREVRHSVPAERDSFVGRLEPLQLLAAKLEAGARLVCVLGMGGTGKTRLVTRFAWTQLGDYPGGVWFCDLSQARTPDGIFFAVAQGLDVPLGKTDPVVQLAHAIAGRGRCLLILDNFEQVARHAEETLGHWLERAPLARFVVTTREVLGIVGEETLALAPLPGADAVALFLRRAESARSGFAPGADDIAVIAKLVKVLDGLPLAIELAAARVRVMAPSALLERMHERFSVLMSRSGRHDRQATLRAAFDWSWDLLRDSEKAGLAQLSVFEGGFSLVSAHAVLELAAGGDPGRTADVVQELVDKSFVRQVSDERFDLLESVRAYAAEHLRTEGRFPGSGAPAAAAAQQRHWAYFAGLDERGATAHGCVETSNLVVACQRALAFPDVPSAIGTLRSAWAALRLRGPLRVGAELAALVDAVAGLREDQRAEVDWVAGSALDRMGEVARAHKHFETGLARAHDAGNRHCEARLLLALASQRTVAGDLQAARDALTHALGLARELADRSLESMALNALGNHSHHQGLLDEARGFYQRALELARERGDRRLEGGLLGNLGSLHHDHGRLDDARGHYDLALALAREVGDRLWEGNSRCNLGLLHHEQGRSAQALTQFEAALTIAREVGHVRLESTVLCNLGLVLEVQGEWQAAHGHYLEAVTGARVLADPRLEGQFRASLGLLLARQGRMAEGRECLVIGEALLRESSDRLSLALLLCARAESEHLAAESTAALRFLQEARVLASQADVGEASELGQALARLKSMVEATSAA